MKRLALYTVICALACFTACSDFLDTVPHDVLLPSTTWKTEDDAQKFVVGCYNNWLNAGEQLYWDCVSDIGYNNFFNENRRYLGNGSQTAAQPGINVYQYGNIQRINVFLDNIDKVTFANDAVKKDLIAQVRAMRAYDYMIMNFWYGGVPIVKYYTDGDEAKIPRESEDAVKKYIYDEIDAAILDINEKPAARGRVAKGVALAIKMRSALYWGDYQRAKDAAQAIIDLKQYELDPSYANVFTVAGQGSKEIILASQYDDALRNMRTVGQMYNNGNGGWSSMVPTQNLVDMYEMEDGLTKEESGDYDAVHPFKGRDPRMAMTVIFPGQDFNGAPYNTMNRTLPNGNNNPNYPTVADNASKTALTWAKYLVPISQYPRGIWNTSASPVFFRYAEVLLSYAEAANELAESPSGDIYDKLDDVRVRVGMPKVDRVKYGTKETLRELIRRERGVELAGEGLRRADIVRWKDSNGKMVAETVLDGPLYRVMGTVDLAGNDPYTRATVNLDTPEAERLIETRVFEPEFRYLPIPQGARDRNPQLTQNPGY